MPSAAPEPKAKNERRRGVATLRRGGETQDQPHNRPVPTDMNDMTLQVEGLGWHGPDHAVPPLLELLTVDRGIPGTRATARVAAHPPFRSPF